MPRHIGALWVDTFVLAWHLHEEVCTKTVKVKAQRASVNALLESSQSVLEDMPVDSARMQ